MIGTYGAEDKHGRASSPCGYTLGGYTTRMVVHEHFAIRIPETYPLECAGPVMCAGITMYDPLKVHNIGKDSHVGIVGLGGLGQMGVRIAKAMGAEVTVISRSASKKDEALACGADTYIAMSEEKDVKAAYGTLDIILNTVPFYHDYVAYHSLLKSSGKQILLGLHKGTGGALAVDGFTCGKSRVKMSLIGGIENTQEIIDLCANNDIRPEIKIVSCEEINRVYEDLDSGKGGATRFVLDISTVTEEAKAKCTADPPKLAEFKDGISPGAVCCECCWLCCCCKWC
jgi:D-arabinose 1-dehydrogenase-like Zn-dependent alcohol dehydrogenase